VLLPNAVIRFVQATQPKEWAKLKGQYKVEAPQRFLARLSLEIARRGTLGVLRNGIKDVGAKIRLASFRPTKRGAGAGTGLDLVPESPGGAFTGRSWDTGPASFSIVPMGDQAVGF